MTPRIWLQLVALVAIAVIPMTVLQMKLQADSATLLFQMVDDTSARATIDSYLDYLRDAAKSAPDKSEDIHGKFNDVAVAKRALEEFFLARDPIQSNIYRQVASITLAALLLSLGAAWLLARAIVRRFERLHFERQAATAKLQDLKSLERWQLIARKMVHDLRAPLTPMKLVASDIEGKYLNLDPSAFATYLNQSQTLVREQLGTIEGRIETFMVFGRLARAHRVPTKIQSFLDEFQMTYGRTLGELVELRVGCHIVGDIALDPKLMRDLLFNLCKNAAEANVGRSLTITITATTAGGWCSIGVLNDGCLVPSSLAECLFEPYASSHNSGTNLGLGLAIARKIALDHGGDLVLSSNDLTRGVEFLCKFPLHIQAAEGPGL